VEKQLEGREWVTGTRSIVDPYLYTVFSWAHRLKIDVSGFTNLNAFYQRMHADTGVQAALKAQGLLYCTPRRSECGRRPKQPQLRMMSGSQVSLADFVVGKQVRTRIRQHDLARFKHIAAVGDLEGLMGVLLFQRYGDALLADGLDDLEDLSNDQRRQPEGGLVKQQQGRLGHERPADGQHLLFTARHGSRPLTGAFLQPWK